MEYAYLKEEQTDPNGAPLGTFSVIRIPLEDLESMKADKPAFLDATYEEWYENSSDDIKAKLDAGEEV